jgi:CRISPR-associated protein Cmr2
MTAHLLLVTLGPVQDFIAQARRTRDLWYGSHLLSELGRAAARALVGGGAELVFPSLKKGDAELDACLAALRPNGMPPLNVANKLLAEVPSGVDPEQVALDTRNAVMQYWRVKVAGPVKAKCAALLADGTDAVWDEQVDTFIEFAASWAPLGDYADARRQIERAVAARKSLRDFGPWVHGRGSVPKSSLDGIRETVLRPPRGRQVTLVRKYRIEGSEQLDAVGLVKRAGGEPEQFVPVVNVALASWVELASRVAAAELGMLQDACRAIGVSRVARGDLPCARPFPFNTSVLLPSRWRSVFDELGRDGDPEPWGRQHVRPIFEKIFEPYPYVACLVADGDRVGRAIDRLGSSCEHRSFSEVLSHFAGRARAIVEQDHRGALIYAGGDDVLAFLPIPEALACAEDLRNVFTEAMASACPSLAAELRPTLSVGLGVGRIMESMGELLTLGREAEQEAKHDRNALAVLVDKRSGGRRSWRARWDDDPARRVHESIALLQGRLPSRKIHEIATTLARLPDPAMSDDAGWARLLALEVRRSLSRIEQGSLNPEAVNLVLDEGAGYATLHGRVRAWVDRLLIARTFALAAPRQRYLEGEAVA